MTNGLQNGAWRGAVKNAVSAICAVIIINFADTPMPLYTWLWFRHVLVSFFTLVTIREAFYWKKWAETPDEKVQRTVQALSAAIDEKNAPDVKIQKTSQALSDAIDEKNKAAKENVAPQ